MNHLIPLSQLTKSKNNPSYLSRTSVVLDKRGIPQGFVFGRDSFISLLTVIDESFEKNVSSPVKAFNNPAGKLIDLIEEHLPLSSRFIAQLKTSAQSRQALSGITLDDITKALHG